MQVFSKFRNLLASSLVFAAVAAVPAQEISIRSLLLEMADLERLAHAPSPTYITRQASSYDRAAKSPEENWFANGDRGNFIRVERRQGRNEHVMAELKGPGTVVRIWSANPQGNIRFYVDGKTVSELVVPMETLTTGKHPDFPPPFSGLHGRGANLYYPIPYERSLKITADNVNARPETLYYQVNYRTYEPGTKVRSFSMADVKDAAKLAEDVSNRLTDPRPAKSFRARVVSALRVLQPGQILAVRTPAGSGEVRQLSVRAVGYAPNSADPGSLGEPLPHEQTLRKVLFEADFDGTSAIVAPLGDFFGSAPGLNAYQCLPFTVYEETGYMVSRWVMPQKQVGRLFFTNHADHPVEVSVEIVWVPKRWEDDTLYFRAKWRRETMQTRPFRDWNFLTATGSGRFVGTAMFISNPVTNWWGEGDEKIYIDGEKFPSTFGTGTEDYFGYAWGSPQIFHHPYHNQTRCDGPGTRGYTAVNRFQILDDMPFTASFRFDMEIWHWAEVTADFAEIAYWYQKPGGSDGFEPLRREDLYTFPIPEPPHVKGAIEGDALKLISKTGGDVLEQSLGDKWSNFRQVWWRDAKPGDRANWEVKSDRTGRMKLTGRFCVAGDYGIVQIYWNGRKVGDPTDFYREALGLVTVEFGEVEVLETNVFEAEIVGANEKAVKRHMFAIDYLLLEST